MVDFDKFEKNVKDNYGNQQFPFDEENWEKAAQLIDASRKGKNRGGIFLLSAVALLCTSGLVYYFGFSESTNALKNKDIAVNEQVTENKTLISENTASSITENSTTSDESVNENSNTPSETKAYTNSSDKKTSTYNSKTSLERNKSINERTSKVNSSNSKTIADKKSTSSNSSNETVSEEKTASNTSDANSGNTGNTKPVNKVKNSSPVKSNSTENSTPPVLANNTSAQPTKNTIVSAPDNGVANNARLGNSPEENQPATTTKTPVVTDSSDAFVTANVKPVESIIDSLPKISKGRADSLAAMLPKGDGVSYATNVKVDHNAKNILFMEAGSTYLLGWNGGGKTEAGGFNVLAGFNFQHYFTGTIAAQIGVQYNTINNLTNSTHTISTVKYDLGVEQDVTSIRYQKLHYLVVPVKFTFNLKEKNIFTVGCNIGYLLNSDSRKEKYKTFSNDPNATKNNLSSTKETGYVKGFSPYDIQIGIGYRRRIYKGLSANAEFFYGLTDTKENSFFKSNNFDRNTGFKVSLCYDLFKK